MRDPHVHPRPESYQSNALSASHLFAGLLPGDNPSCDQSGNLLEHHFPGIRREREHILFVLRRRPFSHGCQKFPRAVFHLGNCSRSRRTVDMHVPDGQKNTHSLSRLSLALLIRDDNHAAVTGRHHRPEFRGNHALRIAKEGEDERGEQHQHDSRHIPMQQKTDPAQHQRRQSEVVAFFDHAPLSKPPHFSAQLSRGERAWSFYDRITDDKVVIGCNWNACV